MYAIREIIPFEITAALFLLAIISYFTGYKKVSALCMLLSIGPVVIPWLKVWLSNLLPWWAAWLLVIAITMVVIKSFLSLIIGKNAADQAIGQMAASFITRVILAPFKLLKPEYLNKAFSGAANTTKLVAQSATSLTKNIRPDTSNNNEIAPTLQGLPTKHRVGDGIEGRVIEVNDHGLLIDPGQGYLGMVDFESFKDEDNTTLRAKYPVDSFYKGTVIRVRNAENLLYIK